MLLHLLHLGSWMVWAAVYVFLMEGSPTFEDTMGKIELSSPVAIVSNILIRLLYNMIQSWSVISGSLQRSCCGCSTLYPFSTKTREVSGNPSLTSERFPETQEREISRVEGNLEGGGDGFPNTFRVLVEHGQSLSINFSTGSGSENPSLWTGKD